MQEDAGRQGAMIRAGKISRATGIILIGIGLLIHMFKLMLNINTNDLLWIIAPSITITGGALLFWHGRQQAAQSTANMILADARPNVLYLRSFRDDSTMVGYVLYALVRGGIAAATEEEQLAEVLRPFGDLVAIGEPGEDLPVPGAARMYASGMEWRGVVVRRMLAARLVVIRAGLSDNLLWEVQQAIANVSSNKVLILFMNMRAKDYEVFRHKVRPFLWIPLPETFRVEQGLLRSTVAGFIAFTPDWEPRFYSLHAPYLRFNSFKPQLHLFKYALRPVFEAARLAWRPPPIAWFMKVALVLAAIFGLLVIRVIVRLLLTRW